MLYSYNEYFYLFIALVLIFLISLIMMLTSIFYFFFANFEKKSAYECGFSALKDTRSNFEISYYLVAILFLVFDLEVLFLLPFVLVFNQLTNLIFYIVLIFVYFLVLGIVYEWRKGALD